MDWSKHLQNGDFLVRSYGGSISMDQFSIHRLAIDGTMRVLRILLNLHDFPHHNFDKLKYNKLQIELSFINIGNVEVKKWTYSIPDIYPICSATIEFNGINYIVLIKGNVEATIECECVSVGKLGPYFEGPIL
jgi:hypothetical protein